MTCTGDQRPAPAPVARESVVADSRRDSCHRVQRAYPDQVVRTRGEQNWQLTRASPVPQLAQAGHGFHPAEDFFDAIPGARTVRTADVPRRAPVQRARCSLSTTRAGVSTEPRLSALVAPTLKRRLGKLRRDSSLRARGCRPRPRHSVDDQGNADSSSVLRRDGRAWLRISWLS